MIIDFILKIPGLSFLYRKFWPLNHAKALGVKFGNGCNFINTSFGSEPYLVKIGKKVTLSNVSFVTHDGSARLFREKYPNLDIIRPIKIGDNVFVGYGCLILPGSIIGNNVIVGAGTVVRGNLLDNCVYAGVPSKKISTIDEWLSKNIKYNTNTKNLTYTEKRIYLMNKFSKD